MNFTEINLQLPPIFQEVEQKIKACGGKFFIGGGSLSNLYMGKDIRDIDIFHEKTIKIEEVKEMFGGYESVETFTVSHIDYEQEAFYENEEDVPKITKEIPFLYRIHYKGYKIELIRSSYDRIYEFDLRFRQFYYIKGKIYATKEAMEDIKQKRIVVVNPVNTFSTFFRMLRFKEELGFEIDEKSHQYVLWAFNRKDVLEDKALQYIKRNEHKISETLRTYLLQWVQKHVKKEKIRVRGAKFPFHKSIEKKIASYFKEEKVADLALYYEQLVSYEPFNMDSFILHVPFSKVERKMKWYVSLLQNVRIKYLFSSHQQQYPFPKIDGKRLEKEHKKLFDPSFLKQIAQFFYKKHDFKQGDLIDGLQWMEENVLVEIKPMIRGNLGEYLAHYTLLLNVGNQFEYVLRKCTNGKYTISEFKDLTPNGAGMYMEAIGDALKEKMPHFFDFKNEELVGVFLRSNKGDYFEYYFGWDGGGMDLVEGKNVYKEIPIDKSKLCEPVIQ